MLILDGITDPQNFGAILRVADGFGVDLVVIPEHESVGLTPAAIKASAGASEWVPVAQVTNLARAIETLRRRATGFTPRPRTATARTRSTSRGKVALVMGSEGRAAPQRARALRPRRVDPDVRPRRLVQRRDRRGRPLLRSSAADQADRVTHG